MTMFWVIVGCSLLFTIYMVKAFYDYKREMKHWHGGKKRKKKK